MFRPFSFDRLPTKVTLSKADGKDSREGFKLGNFGITGEREFLPQEKQGNREGVRGYVQPEKETSPGSKFTLAEGRNSPSLFEQDYALAPERTQSRSKASNFPKLNHSRLTDVDLNNRKVFGKQQPRVRFNPKDEVRHFRKDTIPRIHCANHQVTTKSLPSTAPRFNTKPQQKLIDVCSNSLVKLPEKRENEVLEAEIQVAQTSSQGIDIVKLLQGYEEKVEFLEHQKQVLHTKCAQKEDQLKEMAQKTLKRETELSEMSKCRADLHKNERFLEEKLTSQNERISNLQQQNTYLSKATDELKQKCKEHKQNFARELTIANEKILLLHNEVSNRLKDGNLLPSPNLDLLKCKSSAQVGNKVVSNHDAATNTDPMKETSKDGDAEMRESCIERVPSDSQEQRIVVLEEELNVSHQWMNIMNSIISQCEICAASLRKATS
eukprot:snap_masked-scaffold_27-processed-gene-2.17-mRNA-1 protein AED:1.00 eAED:1.00 QI:0/0/0/0/1/1/3/0/436